MVGIPISGAGARRDRPGAPVPRRQWQGDARDRARRRATAHQSHLRRDRRRRAVRLHLPVRQADGPDIGRPIRAARPPRPAGAQRAAPSWPGSRADRSGCAGGRHRRVAVRARRRVPALRVRHRDGYGRATRQSERVAAALFALAQLNIG